MNDKIALICPHCNKKYKYKNLKSLETTNKYNYNCKKCGYKLIEPDEKKFYNSEGNLEIKLREINFPNKNLWEFVKEEFEEIFVLKTFFNLKKFEIIGKNDVVKEIGTIPKKYFISHILVNVIDENNKVYPFYDIIIDKVEYLLLGDRYNSFYGSYFMEKTPAISNFLKNFFEVYFMKEVVLSYENNIPEDLQKYKN